MAYLRRRSAPLQLPLGPIIADVDGLALTDAERQRLCHPLVGGVILFTRNYDSPAQLRDMTARSMRCAARSCWSASTTKAGECSASARASARLRPMRDLGRLWDRDVLAALREATEIGYAIGAELRAVGVDLSFTPVLDLDHDASGVIGDRAFHSDAARGDAAGQEPQSWPAAGWHRQLRQAFPRSRLRDCGLACRDAGRRAAVAHDPRAGRRALRLARPVAVER